MEDADLVVRGFGIELVLVLALELGSSPFVLRFSAFVLRIALRFAPCALRTCRRADRAPRRIIPGNAWRRDPAASRCPGAQDAPGRLRVGPAGAEGSRAPPSPGAA